MPRLKQTTLAFAFLAASPSVAGAATYYCPWADTVVQIDLSEDQTLAKVKDGGASIRHKSALPTVAAKETIGAATVDTLTFTLNESGYLFTFELQYWSDGDDVRLRNVRQRQSDKQMMTQSGWCISK